MSIRHHYVSLAVVSLSFAGILVGCASPQQPYGAAPQSQSYDRVASYSGTGVVEAIEVTHKESNGVAGTVIGGVAGGLLGSAVGGGTGQVVATVAGAAGGAYAGNKIQRNNADQKQVYNIRVRMSDGSLQNFAQEDNTDFRVGDRVRLDNGRISRY
ncbi:glycine zipper 2TM domain-containing protein [Herbaspirillum sp. YR522]|uniref:glycine zipper 2TM domain-containing protein n=1 Tax=Herbaspirillum sp. YR522 TaxID=1144342 RepID=UPI00026FA2D7|nr:glycine zipper 2TM domain-containing protein [Herbaspirillum sp. YR522]EJN00939.1 putative outer membrane lipoprotein [Herbaspirillum sp. YR522]